MIIMCVYIYIYIYIYIHIGLRAGPPQDCPRDEAGLYTTLIDI